MSSEAKVRFYDRDSLMVVEMVPSADKKKTVKPTIVHARKYGFLYSVTRVCGTDFLASPGLTKWIIEQSVMACIDNPFVSEKTDENIAAYLDMIAAKASEYKELTADIGKKIHKHVELFFAGKETEAEASREPVIWKIICNIRDHFATLGVAKVECEIPIGRKDLGYAGTPDLYATLNDGTKMIFDLKTTDLNKYKEPHLSWKLQTGAYDNLLSAGARHENIIADRNNGDVAFEERPDSKEWANAFSHLFEVFVMAMGYDPRKYEPAV
jgi:hypothetical protein